MSRRNSAAVPTRPVAPPAAPPRAGGRVPRAGASTARADGSIAEVSGSMDQLTPMQDEGLRDAAQQSSNLSFNQGGAPVRTVIEDGDDSVPRPSRFRVVEDKDVAHGGHRFKLRAGKEIDTANYDVAMLQRYGVKLEPVEVEA